MEKVWCGVQGTVCTPGARSPEGTGQRTLVWEFFMLYPVLIYLYLTVFQETP